MVPSSICRPEGYRPVYQEVARGVFEVINAYEGTYRYFDRPGGNGHPAGEARIPIVRRRTTMPAADGTSGTGGKLSS
jgi:hypothetical protein